jgi:hypothetical protein
VAVQTGATLLDPVSDIRGNGKDCSPFFGRRAEILRRHTFASRLRAGTSALPRFLAEVIPDGGKRDWRSPEAFAQQRRYIPGRRSDAPKRKRVRVKTFNVRSWGA